jgi:hypothetical protein
VPSLLGFVEELVHRPRRLAADRRDDHRNHLFGVLKRLLQIFGCKFSTESASIGGVELPQFLHIFAAWLETSGFRNLF